MSDMERTIARLIAEGTGAEAQLEELTKLHGDASYRTYYRARMEDGSSFVVMKMPDGPASASEEITNFKGTHEELPFINISKYLSSLGIPVPAVHIYSEADHIMALEDLGDDLLAGRVDGAEEPERLGWYGRALDLLILIQARTKEAGARSCVADARSFDATLLDWEFDHFREYAIEARLGRRMSQADREAFEEETRAITREIVSMPYGFTHRDFQSRNIVIKDGALYLIDFQDALSGPRAYDLVALTRDSYVRLADGTVEELLRRYCERSDLSCEGIRREFDLVTVQRKLKDAGRFVYIDRVKGNSGFLRYIPTSLEYVRTAIGRLPERARLAETISKYLPEWS